MTTQTITPLELAPHETDVECQCCHADFPETELFLYNDEDWLYICDDCLDRYGLELVA